MDRLVLKSNLCDTKISVEDDIGREKPCLCICKGGKMAKVANFNNEVSAQIFMIELAAMIGATIVE